MAMYERTVPFNGLPHLPPPELIETDTAVLRKLVAASRALATVNGNVMRLPNPDMLINTIGLQEAKTSTAIENIFTTEDDLYKALSDTAREDLKTNPAAKEVLRYREALWDGYNNLVGKPGMDLDAIIKIFQQIKDTGAALRQPQAMVVIRKGDSDLRPGEVVYTPPRGEGVIEPLMDNLLDYMNNDEKYPADPLLKMCVAHYQFEAIHPFQDGNGRTGRVINLLYLVQKKLLSRPILYLSKYIIMNKDDYYYNLATVTQRGTWKNWVMYMLEGIEQTAMFTNELINQILAQMEATLEQGKKTIRWYNKDINEALFSQPYSRPKIVGDVLNKSSRTTLTKYMDELVKAGILSPKRDGKEVYYLNDDLIRILEH